MSAGGLWERVSSQGGEIFFSALGMLQCESVMLDAAPVFCRPGGEAHRLTELHSQHRDLPACLHQIRKTFLCTVCVTVGDEFQFLCY